MAGRASPERQLELALGDRRHRLVGIRGSLWIIGILNLMVLGGIIKGVSEDAAGQVKDQELDDHLNRREFMNALSAV